MTRPRERAPGGRPSPEPEAAARHEYGDLPAVGTVRPGDRTVPDGIGAQGIVALQRVAGNGAVQRLVAPGGERRIQRFDAAAGGHQGMEREAGGLDAHGGLAEPKHLGDPDPAKGTREAGVNAIYAGNFMQDFSQINVPTFQAMLTKLPRDPVRAARGEPGTGIGARGAESVSTALIRALAILDVGPRLADEVVATNMQSYRPEQHVDQPIGYSAATDTLVRDSASGALRPGRRTVEGGRKSGQAFDPGAVETVDRDRDTKLAGSAVPGAQVENPALFEVNASGLQNHIYNSAEWIKGHWKTAARLGPTDSGRFHVGAGLHAIEDYFAHSNFVEVGLNGYIDRALARRGRQSAGVRSFLGTVQANERASRGRSMQVAPGGRPGARTHVDTMFDASVAAPGSRGRRQAVTTGSVGSNDMRASIGHILLPKVPQLQSAIDHSVERIFHLVDKGEVSSWDGLKKTIGEDRPMAAVMALADGLDGAGTTLPVPDGVKIIYGREIPLPFVDNIDIPTDAEITWADEPISRAIGTYVGWVKAVKSTIDDVKDVMETIKWIAYPMVKLVQWLIRKLEALIREELEKLKNAVKQQIALLIVNLLDTISGVDVRNEANRTIGDALKDAHERVEDFEHQTSLQARLLPPGDLAGLRKDEVEAVVGPVRDAPGGGWIAQGALPPSHSEIAKDHAPADPGLATHAPGSPIGGAVGGAVHGLGGSPDTRPLDPTASPPGAHVDADEGSVFYGIARALALEADRHVLRQVEAMWAGQGSLYGDAGGLDTSAMQVGHEAFGAEASLRAGAEEKRAARDGFKHAQSDAANRDLMARPEVRALLDLVDLIISHPEDSTWWRAVVDRYVDQHPDEVAHHIMARNAVRGARTTVAP